MTLLELISELQETALMLEPFPTERETVQVYIYDYDSLDVICLAPLKFSTYGYTPDGEAQVILAIPPMRRTDWLA